MHLRQNPTLSATSFIFLYLQNAISRFYDLNEAHPLGSEIDLCHNCAKTLCNCVIGGYFEREADSPKLLKTLKRRTKEGIFGRDERACKAGALPTELHAHCGDLVHSKAFPVIPKCSLAFSMISAPKLCGVFDSRHLRARQSSKY